MLKEHHLAAVAVPVPLASPLTYTVPPGLRPLVQKGIRVRVPVGKRRLIGVVVDLPLQGPEGVRLRDLEAIVDAEPLLPPDLLDLAGFAAQYYLAPLGEVLRAILPLDLSGWGQRRVELTDAGALWQGTAGQGTAGQGAPGAEASVLEVLRIAGAMTASELQKRLGGGDLPAILRDLARAGRVRIHDGAKSGARYISAFELPPGDLARQLEACGRSAPGREVVEYLDALGRPATGDEVTAAVGCTVAVLRRLVKLGVLRKFSQVCRVGLDRHLMPKQAEPAFVLRRDQKTAVTALQKGLEEGEFRPFLLHGMTGAGKTEVYLRAVETTLNQGRTAILLVPEIALVPALARAVRDRFGERLALLHSNLTAGERRQEWQRIQAGGAQVVLGPRSAIFAPVRNLGLVVVDEEQDSAYKQETTPRYHGRDLALVRARSAGSVALLVSATPSLESRHNADQGRYGFLQLTERVGQGSLPQGILVDLKDEEGPRRPGEIHFSTRLRQEIEATLADGFQVILLRNRRGYSPRLLCRACGEDLRCEDCGLPRTYHLREARLICHYCGSKLPTPTACPACSEEALEPIGAGTERLEEQFRALFPGICVDVLDRDATRRPGGAAAVLERFGQGETQVLIGTQMVSKGHHFPKVALTAVMSADTYLSFPDFRAVERTYNLLVQLAGRAGRGEIPGRVVIQTYHPDHYAIRAALNHDDHAFATEEMRFRRTFHYPPFTRMVQLLLRDSNRQRGAERLEALARRISRHPLCRGVRLSGPAPAPFEKLRAKWRFQLLLRGPNGRQLRQLLQEAVVPHSKGLDLTLDIDPQDLL